MWQILNSVIVVLALFGGYESLNPDRLRRTNPDLAACLAILVVVPVFAILSVGYSLRRSKTGRLRRPAWNRNPFNWWGDPLLSLFFFNCVMAAMAVGSAVRRPTFGSGGFWTLGVYACFTVGLFVGQILAYRIYRQGIATT